MSGQHAAPSVRGGIPGTHLADANGLSVELDHVHDAHGVVRVFLREELDEAVVLHQPGDAVARDVHVHCRAESGARAPAPGRPVACPARTDRAGLQEELPEQRLGDALVQAADVERRICDRPCARQPPCRRPLQPPGRAPAADPGCGPAAVRPTWRRWWCATRRPIASAAPSIRASFCPPLLASAGRCWPAHLSATGPSRSPGSIAGADGRDATHAPRSFSSWPLLLLPLLLLL